MNNNKFINATLEANDFAMTMTIIKVLTRAAIDRDDKEEASLMQELFNCLTKYTKNNDGTVSIKLNYEQGFAMWLSLNVFKDFCIHTMDTTALEQAERIMRCFQPQH